MTLRFIHGGDAARLHGTPSLASVASAEELGDLVRAAAHESEAGRWILLGGFDPARLDVRAEALSRALDEAAPGHPVCLWSADHRIARVNAAAVRFGKLPGVVLEFPATDAVRRILPRWTMEVWKDRLGLLAADLAAEGVTHLIDLDETAGEGWRALDDEGLLVLEEVGVVCAAKSLRRQIREGERTGKGRGRTIFSGVVFDFDRDPWSVERTTEELRLARDAGIRIYAQVSDSAARAKAESALLSAGPFDPDLPPVFVR